MLTDAIPRLVLIFKLGRRQQLGHRRLAMFAGRGDEFSGRDTFFRRLAGEVVPLLPSTAEISHLHRVLQHDTMHIPFGHGLDQAAHWDRRR